MSYLFYNLERAVRAQIKGHSGDTVEMVGEQLLDIARGDDCVAELLITDLNNPEMSVINAEKKIKAYADEIHKKKGGSSVGVSPKKAEEIRAEKEGIDVCELM